MLPKLFLAEKGRFSKQPKRHSTFGLLFKQNISPRTLENRPILSHWMRLDLESSDWYFNNAITCSGEFDWIRQPTGEVSIYGWYRFDQFGFSSFDQVHLNSNLFSCVKIHSSQTGDDQLQVQYYFLFQRTTSRNG